MSSSKDHDQASQSGSEDGNYPLYGDANRMDADVEDEVNSLTSQTLNADGTPKRPMNAFMIFARRRRPQVSAENQAMRTGEISKILSREWVSMPASEKQFYLEQAKQLKDNFNSKYPDYVYRRRPNNSRRRRQPSVVRSESVVTDTLDDVAPRLDDVSPTDGNEHMDYSRLAHDMTHGGESSRYAMNNSRSSSHPYGHPQDPSFSGRDSRGYGPSSSVDRHASGYSANSSPRLVPSGMNYSYSHPPSHVSSSSMYNSGEGSQLQGWSRNDRGQSSSNWMSGSNDRLPSGSMSSRSNYPSSSWANADTTPMAASPSSSSNYFPTLNTPFYPSHGQPPFQSNSASSSSHHHHHSSASPPQSYDSLGAMSSTPRDYSRSSYGPSSTLGSNSPYGSTPSGSSSRDPYSQRSLPPVQTTNSGYSHAHSQPSSSSSSGHGHGHGHGGHGPTPHSYWPSRD